MQKLHDDHGFEIIELQFLYDVFWLPKSNASPPALGLQPSEGWKP